MGGGRTIRYSPGATSRVPLRRVSLTKLLDKRASRCGLVISLQPLKNRGNFSFLQTTPPRAGINQELKNLFHFILLNPQPTFLSTNYTNFTKWDRFPTRKLLPKYTFSINKGINPLTAFVKAVAGKLCKPCNNVYNPEVLVSPSTYGQHLPLKKSMLGN